MNNENYNEAIETSVLALGTAYAAALLSMIFWLVG
jgi:hypothetical protein